MVIIRHLPGLLLGIGLFFTTFSTPGLAQSTSEVWFRNFGLEEGLPNSTVTHFHQDSQGFIWLSTQGGIVRYDGYDFKSYTLPAENNIPQSNIAGDILEDSRGVIWVGYQTNHYIARYDWVHDEFDFLDMEKELEINGIDRVRLLGIDKQQNLWASLLLEKDPKDPIIIRLDTSDQSMHAYMDEDNQSTIEHGFVLPEKFAQHVNKNPFLAEDNNTVWIGANDGLIKIDSNGDATSYATDKKGLRDGPIYHVLDVNDKIWAATDSGLVAYDEQQDRFNPVSNAPPALQKASVQHLYRDDSGAIWITAEYSTYRYRNGNFSSLNDREELAPLGKISIMPQVETENQIWFVNQENAPPSRMDATMGFTIYEKKEDRFHLYKENLQDIGIEDKRLITGIFQDKSGSIWMGTPYYGLLQYPPNYKKFNTHFTSDDFVKKLNEQSILRAAESPNGNYFASSVNGQIFVTDPTSGEESIFYQVKAPSSDGTGDRNFIIDFHWESPSELLIATEFSGVQRITYDPNTFEIQDTTIWKPSQMKSGNPFNFITDEQNQLWIGTTNGVIKTDLDNNQFTRVNAHEVPPGGRDTRNWFGQNVYKDSEGYLWYYFPEKAGIKRLNPRTENVKAYNTAEDVSEELVITYVFDVLETRDGNFLAIDSHRDQIFILNPDSARFEPYLDQSLPVPNSLAQNEKGEIVVSTLGYGFFWIDPETRKVVHRLSTGNGLASNVGNDAYIDSTGTHWLLHSLGITKYQPENDNLLNYSADRGLPASQSESGHWFFEGSESTVFPLWWSVNGISSFNPYNVTASSYSASPTFTDIRAGDKKLPLSSESEITIQPDNNNITLNYSALQFSEPSGNEYRYKLNNTEWTGWQQSHQASFAQLAPGTYTFEVEARNADRVKAQQTASYTFTIVPPWYQSTMAYLLYIIFGIGGLTWAAFWYSNYRTEQQAMQMQAEQAKELAKLDRMKTNLLTNISHELRTPLTLILGPIEQLRDKATELGQDWQRRLDIAHRNGKRLRQLVEQVLDLTRLDAQHLELKPANIELNSFLRRLSESFESMAEQQEVTINTILTEDPIKMQADPDKLEKAMVNLLSNAIKFTPPGGTITLSTQNNNKTTKITVADTGRGIASDQLPHIFDRFHSTSEEISGGGKGLGVGLAIAKEFVELHQGSISVESEESTGTTFTITLPQKSPDPSLDNFAMDDSFKQVEKKVSHRAQFRSIDLEEPFTVLVVEDNEDMRSYIADLLNDDNLLVETASNGLEAQKRLSIIDPDLIISDIMMPKMDGFAFAEHVRSDPSYRLTPIVMLSARAEVEDRIQGYKIGVSDYLVKPFDKIELKARVQNLLHRKTEREKYFKENGNDSTIDSGKGSSLVIKLKKYVEANLSESNIKVEQLTQEVNVSRRQLYRNLKAETGCTPAEFIREIRLYNARDMLEENKKQTISEIAYAVGFSTPSYFSKLFKERFGRSPSEYGK